jgi:hypothetical protein
LTLGDAGLMMAAFDYSFEGPAGYTTHTFEGLPTQCVYVDRYRSDVREQPTSATYSRPTFTKAGIASAALGVVVLLYPRTARRAPSIAITPTAWVASKTFGF